MRSAALGVLCPQKADGRVYLQGRPCLDYERIDNWVVDPDSLRSQPAPILANLDKHSISDTDEV